MFFLKADICQLGVDQRKVNMLAREYCDAVGIKLKPVILSHHMLYGLKVRLVLVSECVCAAALHSWGKWGLHGYLCCVFWHGSHLVLPSARVPQLLQS